MHPPDDPERKKKCIFINNQNFAGKRFDHIKQMFAKHHFKFETQKNVKQSQLDKEITLENKKYAKYAYLVICIFAECRNKHGFMTHDEKEILTVDFVKKFISQDENAIKVFILLTDTREAEKNIKLETEKDTNITWNNLSQISNVFYTSFVLPVIDSKQESSFSVLLNKFSQIGSSIKNTFEAVTCIPTSFGPTEHLESQMPFPIKQTDMVTKNLGQLNQTIFTISSNFIFDNSVQSNFNNTKPVACNSTNKDLCLILRFDLEQEKLKLRKDIKKDVKALESTFAGLGFAVESYANLTYNQIELLFIEAKTNNFYDSKCFVLCLVTHLEDEWLYLQNCAINFKSFLKTLSEISESFNSIQKIIIVHDPFENTHIQVDPLHLLSPELHPPIPNILFIKSSHYEPVQTATNGPVESVNACKIIEYLCHIMQKYSGDFLSLFQFVTLAGASTKNNIHIMATTNRLVQFKFNNSNHNDSNIIRKFTSSLSEYKKNDFENKYGNKAKFLLMKKESLFYHIGQDVENRKFLILKTENSKVTDQDIASLKQTFHGRLNFDDNDQESVIELNDFKALQAFNIAKCDCVVLILFVDGLEDAQKVVEIIAEYLASSEKFANKPKLLFVNGYQPTLYRHLLPPDANHKDGQNSPVKNKQVMYIPRFSDCMILYSEEVSSTVKSLCQVLDQHAQQYDLMSMLALVNKCNIDANVEMPYINSTLTRLVSFKQLAIASDSQFDDHYNLFNSNITRPIRVKNRGVCIIFNYEEFPNAYIYEGKPLPKPKLLYNPQRKGTQFDEMALRKTFEMLKFEVLPEKKDLTKQETLDELKKISETNHKNIECFVLCVMTHGFEDGTLACNDWAYIDEHGYVNDPNTTIHRNLLVSSLVGNSSLKGIPKLIILQACHGDSQNEPITVADNSLLHRSNKSKSTNKPISLYEYRFPQHEDLYIFTSTYPGFVSNRNTKEGTWFIQTLCRMIELYGTKYDLTTIAAQVCKFVAHEMENRVKIEANPKLETPETTAVYKQMPCLYTTMAHPIKFEHTFY